MTPRDYEEAMVDLHAFAPSAPSATATVPVIFWVILSDDGLPALGANLTDADVEAVLDYLDAKFSTHPDYDFNFVHCGKINHIYNTTLKNGTLHAFDYAHNPYAVNVYLETTPANTSADYPWDVYGNRIFLQSIYDLDAAKISFTHEMGHSFGLFHSFGPDVFYQIPPDPLQTNNQMDHPYNNSLGATPRELVIRTQALTQTYATPNHGGPPVDGPDDVKGGDLVGDTPAGCNASNPSAFPGCSFNGCVYNGNYLDYNQMPIDDPDNIIAKNLMSYGSCRQEFTNGQLERAYSYYDNQRKFEYKPQWCGNLDDRIEYEGTDHGIDRVAIEFTQSFGSVHIKTMTNPEGDFHGIVIPVTPSSSTVSAKVNKLGKNNPDFSFTYSDWIDGISTFDLIIIRKHILNPINDRMDGYDQIAADVNNSGSVTTADYNEIRHLILGSYFSFPAFNQPWRFIRETVTLTNPLHFDDGNDDNPFQFTNLDGYQNYSIVVGKQGFDAVKLGDVNGSNLDVGSLNGNSETEVGEPIYVDIIKQVSNGISTYEFKVEDFENIVSYQMEIEFPEAALQLTANQAMDLTGVVPDFFGTAQASQGIIKTIWLDEANVDAATLPDGSGIFRLVFNGTTGQLLDDVQLVENLGFRANNEVTDDFKCFAYSPDGTIRPIIQRKYHGGIIAAVGVSPNPFSNSFKLQLEAVTEGEINVQLFNVMGQRVFISEEALFAGTNNLEFSNLGQYPDGIYFVQIGTGKDSIVKKLIKKN